MVKGPERIETSRLVLRKPTLEDASAVFTRYASDPEVTKYLSWPQHQSVEQTKEFLQFSDLEWTIWPAGPYLIESRSDARLLGGTGLAFEAPGVASTGYVFARDSWGQGYATEALEAIVEIARGVHVRSLWAICHPDHRASVHVLEKCGFGLAGRAPAFAEFPNLLPPVRQDCLRYAMDPATRGRVR
jgi:[ribosomal protein S5]-alanine N-acetyltransferase